MDHLKEWLWLIGPALTFLVLPAAAWWLSHSFVTRVEFDGIKKRLDHHEARLDGGERRFAAVEAAIREVTHAADDARRAAETATKAADKIHAAEVQLTRLEGQIDKLSALLRQTNEHTGLLLRGHLDIGGKS